MSTVTLISDFNISDLAHRLGAMLDGEGFSLEQIPYGQLYGELDGTRTINADGLTNISIIWVQPQVVSATYAKSLSGEVLDEQQFYDDIRDYITVIDNYSQKKAACLLVTFCPPHLETSTGIHTWHPGHGSAYLMAKANLMLADHFRDHGGVKLLDVASWVSDSTMEWNPRHWYATKTPFNKSVFANAAGSFYNAIKAFAGESRRIIFVDLDNTIWGGVVGDVGTSGLRLGGHDHIGEAFVEFQMQLRALRGRGVQLALVSKNTEAIAMDAFENHPEMILKKDDLAGWKINWGDKAENISELLKELNFGSYSAVFLDDNPVERERVSDAFPEMLVPDWPTDPCRYVDSLRHLDCFSQPYTSSEDLIRTKSYSENKERIKVSESGDRNWLAKLETVLTIDPLSDVNIQRAHQLLSKTNQMNLSTRRLSLQQLQEMRSDNAHQPFVASVTDKFGSLGIVAVFICERQANTLVLTDFVLSCRAMGREIEQQILSFIIKLGRFLKCDTATLEYVKTARNGPTLEVIDASIFEKITDYNYAFRVENECSYSPQIHVNEPTIQAWGK